MKITFLIDGFGAGGKERQLFYLIRHLSHEHNIQLIILNDDLFYKEILNFPIYRVIIPIKERYSFRTVYRIYNELKIFNPDIIHTWDNVSHCIASPFFILNTTKVINGSIRYAGTFRKRITTILLKKVAYATSNLIISNSKQGLVADKLEKSRKCKVIHNGLDSYIFKNTSSRSVGDLQKTLNRFLVKIVMVGRFYPLKDYITYIRSAIITLKESNLLGYFCIGDGPGRADAEKEAGIWNKKNIFFLGRRNDVHNIIQYFDIGIMLNNTNGHAEGISNAIMEYMAAGLPVIATNAGGTPELVSDNNSGFLVPAFNPEIVAEKIKILVDNENERNKMGEVGKRIIYENYSLEKMVSAYIRTYNSILNES
jgi:glycosyltransferase involved in cell wall biosynthesis